MKWVNFREMKNFKESLLPSFCYLLIMFFFFYSRHFLFFFSYLFGSFFFLFFLKKCHRSYIIQPHFYSSFRHLIHFWCFINLNSIDFFVMFIHILIFFKYTTVIVWKYSRWFVRGIAITFPFFFFAFSIFFRYFRKYFLSFVLSYSICYGN